MMLRISNNAEGWAYYSDMAEAIIYAADNGARVINLSWGGLGTSQVLHDAIEYAHQKNAVTVAAAGNGAGDVLNFSPANEMSVITVAASDINDEKARFSNFGTMIDVSAPGVDILSLKSSTGSICTDSVTVGYNYCRLWGTSMAAPHVAGLAALILTKHPEFTNNDVRQVLHVSADDTELPGFDVNTGFGRINAAKALEVNSIQTIAAPSIAPINNSQSIYVVQNFTFTITASDPQGLPIILSLSGLPQGATFGDQGTGVGVFSWTPAWGQDGSYQVIVNASNRFQTSSASFNITAVNPYPPTTVSIKSPDVNGDGLVTIADILAERNAYGTSNPTYDVDGDGKITISDIMVVMNAYGLKWPPSNLPETRKISFFILGNDPGGKPLSFDTSTLPRGSNLTNPDGNVEKNRRLFSWTPDFSQQGFYPVTFRASNGTTPASQSLNITVLDVPIKITSVTTSYSCGLCLAFRPSLGQTATINFSFNHEGWWGIEIRNSAGALVSVFGGENGGTGVISQNWNGKNNSTGIILSSGIYTFTVQAFEIGDGNVGDTRTGTLTIQ